jgi:hypothetical protein
VVFPRVEDWDVSDTKRPPPPPRDCSRCGARVTTTGQTHGVFCDQSACPFPKLNWGVPAAKIDPPATDNPGPRA